MLMMAVVVHIALVPPQRVNWGNKGGVFARLNDTTRHDNVGENASEQLIWYDR